VLFLLADFFQSGYWMKAECFELMSQKTPGLKIRATNSVPTFVVIVVARLFRGGVFRKR
jgi:hypothetical protein